MAKHKLFCVPGTWEVVEAADGRPEITPAAEVGMLTGVTNLLDRRVFDVVYVNYPASFGPIPGPGQNVLDALGDPSYIDSRDMGVAEVQRLIGEHRALVADRRAWPAQHLQGDQDRIRPWRVLTGQPA